MAEAPGGRVEQPVLMQVARLPLPRQTGEQDMAIRELLKKIPTDNAPNPPYTSKHVRQAILEVVTDVLCFGHRWDKAKAIYRPLGRFNPPAGMVEFDAGEYASPEVAVVARRVRGYVCAYIKGDLDAKLMARAMRCEARNL